VFKNKFLENTAGIAVFEEQRLVYFLQIIVSVPSKTSQTLTTETGNLSKYQINKSASLNHENNSLNACAF
jgi:hypothetical protein